MSDAGQGLREWHFDILDTNSSPVCNRPHVMFLSPLPPRGEDWEKGKVHAQP